MNITRQVLSRAKTLVYLEALEAQQGPAISAYLSAGMSALESKSWLEKFFQDKLPDEVLRTATSSETGACLFGSVKQGCLILPPFPLPASYIEPGYTIAPLRAILQQDYKIALVLVRLGTYAIGVSQGENLLHSKVGTGLVHGRHRQGGSSAARFRRHREKQMEIFLTRVCGHVREHLEPEVRGLDYLVYGGAWNTILLTQKACQFLGRLETPLLPPLLDIPDPNQAVLEKSINRVWSSTVMEWSMEPSI